MAKWAQKIKLHHLQMLVALGEQGNLTRRRTDDEYHPTRAFEMVVTTRR